MFRWSRTERATDEGELKNPVIITSTIARGIDVERPYRTPATPMPVRPITIQIGSGRRLEKRAMKNDPTTKPTEVRPSWSPYSNSVAPSSRIENGSRSTFHSPKEKNMKALTRNSERRIGVPIRVVMPDRRFSTITETVASSSGFGIG